MEGEAVEEVGVGGVEEEVALEEERGATLSYLWWWC